MWNRSWAQGTRKKAASSLELAAGSATGWTTQARYRADGRRVRCQDLGADAAGVVVLGGLLAVPGGEWAPAASIGFAAGGV